MTQNVQPAGSAATNYGIVAWIVYGVISGSGHWIAASLVALIIALAIVAHEYKYHATKIMSCTTVAFFAFALMITVAVGPALFKYYNVFLTWGAFAIVTWVTLLIGFPFTIQYAREQTPREIWDHPLFMRLNVILTVSFALAFTINAGLGVIALRTGYLLSLGLLLPIFLLSAAIVFSARYPKHFTQRFAPAWAAAAQASTPERATE
jgi:all-trans-retinol 13,14-reductase